jgi:DnaJ-class molecular chaperone
MLDYYKVLGIDENASFDDIRKSYRKLSLKHHPDKGGSKEKFNEISEAYEVLSDKEKREEYNRRKNNIPNTIDPSKIFNMFFNKMGVHTENDNNYNDMPFNIRFTQTMNGNKPDIKIFKNGYQVHQNFMNHMNKPTPIIQKIQISLQQAFNGLQYPIEIERWIKEKDETQKTEKETIYIDIPCGIDTNEIIVMREKGNILYDIKGDIKIFIKVDNNSCFIRNGLDLIYKKTLSLKDSLCGFEFVIKHLNEKTFTITNKDTIIKPGFHKVIPNLGLKRNNKNGNLIIEFNIEFPDKIDDKNKEILRNIL